MTKAIYRGLASMIFLMSAGLSANANDVSTGVDTSHKVPVTEIFSKDWIQLPTNIGSVDLSVSVKGGVWTDVGYVVFKRKATDTQFAIDSKGVLQKGEKGQLTARLKIEDGNQYVIRFQGASFRPSPALFDGMIKLESFTVQARLLGPSGQALANSDEQIVSIYRNDPEGLYTANTMINGQFYMK